MRKIKIVHLSKRIFNVLLFGLIAVSVARGQGFVPVADPFQTTNSGPASQTYQDDLTGNVGIGTTTPAANLHVVSFSASLPILGTGSTPATPAAVQIDNNSNNSNNVYLPYSFIINRVSSIATPPSFGGLVPPGGLNQATVDFVVDQNGNTGVGTPTPAAKLDVMGQFARALFIGTEDPLHVSADGTTPALYVTAANAVGILTATPQAMLDVNGSGNQYQYDYGTDPLHVSADGVTPTLYVTTGGNVGIGTATPAYPLDVVGDAHVSNIVYSTGVNTVGNVNVGQSLTVAYNTTIGGVVQIGATKPVTATYTPFALSVAGNVVAQQVLVETSDWSDKVFDKMYNLQPLSEIETYVNQNKHLPEIPSECEVIEKGVNLGEMNKLLLQKVEELTLYMIQQQKEIDALKAKK